VDVAVGVRRPVCRAQRGRPFRSRAQPAVDALFVPFLDPLRLALWRGRRAWERGLREIQRSL